MLIINNPEAPWIYVEEEGGGDDSKDTAESSRHRRAETQELPELSSQSCDSMHKACLGTGQTKSQHEEGKWTQS